MSIDINSYIQVLNKLPYNYILIDKSNQIKFISENLYTDLNLGEFDYEKKDFIFSLFHKHEFTCFKEILIKESKDQCIAEIMGNNIIFLSAIHYEMKIEFEGKLYYLIHIQILKGSSAFKNPNLLIGTNIISNINEGLVIIDNNGNIIYNNNRANEILDTEIKENTNLYNSIRERTFWEEYEENGQFFKTNELGITKTIEEGVSINKHIVKLKGRNDNIKWILYSSFPIKYNTKSNKSSFSCAIFLDITYGMASRIQLEKETERFTELYNNVPVAILTVNESGFITSCNPKCHNYFGYSTDSLKEKHFSLLLDGKESSRSKIPFNKILSEQNITNDIKYGNPIQLIKKDGTSFPVKMAIEQLTENEHFEAIIIIKDVTNELLINKTKETLNEKEILLREIHHRVKNNMQIISSLISLTANKHEGIIRDNLLETKSRISAMALVHEQLYETKDLKHVKSNRYIRNLIDHIKNLQFYKAKVDILIDIDEFDINIDTAIPLGLIINEIMTNIFKYAFSNTDQGRINFSLKKKQNLNILKISDNGKGLEDLEALKNSKSLGFKLINSLAKQLKAEIEVKNKNGLAYKLTFK